MTTNKKFFPIKTDTACQLKWAWSTVSLVNGQTQSCHRTDPHLFDINTFNFHNTTEKIKQRELMLDGKWPYQGCEYCKNIEDTGIGQSDRQFFLNVPDITPKELEFDNKITTVTPTILEVYLDNTCNLKCIYCIPELSSRIDYELKKYGRFEKNGLILESKFKRSEQFDYIEENFWKWMINNSSTLTRLHLLGGEPFYQKQFDKFIEFFNNNPCPLLEFNIVTNLMLPFEQLIRYILVFYELLKIRHLKRLDITVSIDCWGEEQEYVRYGLDLAKWEKNFNYLISQKWIKLNINSTISALTIKTMSELILKLNDWNKERKIEHYFSTTIYPSYMHPSILGPNEFKNEFNEILNLMETATWRGTHAKQYMEGIAATIKNSHSNPQEILKLITFLDENDRRRGTNWKILFPWLEKYVV